MSGTTAPYDIAFIGHYTKDTIVSSAGTRLVDGGACNYGANVAVRMGLRTAAVTRLAEEDFHIVEGLRRLGVEVYARVTPASTCLSAVGIPNLQRGRACHHCDQQRRTIHDR